LKKLDDKVIQDFLDRGGMIKLIPYYPDPYQKSEISFPIYPKGKKIYDQDDGCLMVPRYGGC